VRIANGGFAFLKPFVSILGLDRELFPNFAVTAAYTYRHSTDFSWHPRIGMTSADFTARAPVTLRGYTAQAYAPSAAGIALSGGGRILANRPGYHVAQWELANSISEVLAILAERRAGKFIADVSSEGITSNYRALHLAKSFDPIKPALLLPEVTDESHWYQGKHRYIDPEGQFVFRYVGTQQQGNIAYNTKLVNPKEIRSVWDLVDARWKGKIIARDVRVPGPGSAPMRFFYLHPAIGPTFIKKLFGEMDVTLFRDFRQSIDWLASGKASLCFFCSDTDKAKLQGLPVDEFVNFKEGAPLVTQYGTLALLNRAPHANAAKVFINWFLSRDGQIALQKSLARSGAETADSLRIDIPKDDVKPENRRAPGVNYLDIDSQVEWTEMKPVLAIFEEALANAEKQKK